MYLIYADDICLHDSTSPAVNKKVYDPTLTLEDNSAGSLEFTLPPINSGYSLLRRYSQTITVMEYENGRIVEKWWGRIATDDRDYNNNRSISCEGALSFLSDTIQPRKQYTGTIIDFISGVLSIHNQKVPANRKIFPGHIAIEDLKNNGSYTNINIWTCYNTTLETITESVSEFSVHMSIRKTQGHYYLDILDDINRYGKSLYTYEERAIKEIRFGKNLMDFQEHFNIINLVTSVIPLGATIERENKYETNENDGIPQEYYTIASVNHKDNPNAYTSSGQDDPFHTGTLTNAYEQSILAIEDIQTYGFYEIVLNFDEEKNKETLYSYGKAYLDSARYDYAEYEIEAIDGKFMGNDVLAMEMYDYVNLISVPHKLVNTEEQALVLTKMPILKMEIDLSHPGNIRYTLNKISYKNISDTYKKAKKAGNLPDSR